MELRAKVKAVLEARDLGGHLTTMAKLGGSTLALRMRKATAYCHRLACFPWGWKAKQRVVETLVYPLALYGCEASPINDGDMAKLTTAVARAIGPYSQNSSTILASLLCAKGRNMSGDFAVLNRSFNLLRRITVKHPQAKLKIQRIYQHYLRSGKAGTLANDAETFAKSSCPPPGLGSRALWNDAANTKGPIGLLLSRVHGSAAFLC